MTQADQSAASRIEDRLRESARRDPLGTAFICRDESVSFSELCSRADRFAASLNASDVTPSARIGIFMFKHIDMPAALYGVLSAGCTYVPLDPLTAAYRLQQIVEDCDIEALVCDAMTFRRAKGIAKERDLLVIANPEVVSECQTLGIRALCWDTIDGADEGYSPSVPAELAYIIYTSGSTGTPKGIAHTHASALAYVDACFDAWDFTSSDRFANHSPLHFDMATMEFLVAPIVGACAVLVTEDLMKLPASMAQLMEDEHISVWYSVPVALIQLLDSGALAKRDLTALRKVIFAGEAFPVARLRELCEALPGPEYSNAYGPTETNVCTVAHIDPQTLEATTPVPIGMAWLDTVARVEVDDGRVAAEGEAGELLIAGATVMAGYWRRPELDRAAFVERDGRRFYRTGDLVHCDSHGVLSLHGRIDRQIKHRGFRIELDEIENVLYSHADVASGVAFLDESVDELVAVIAFRSGVDQSESTRQLRRHMKQRLPAYAVPQRMHIIDSLPTGANNKLDRQALRHRFAGSSVQQAADRELSQ